MVETFYKTEVTEEKYTESAEYHTLALIHLRARSSSLQSTTVVG
jgi:hypothetical protein